MSMRHPLILPVIWPRKALLSMRAYDDPCTGRHRGKLLAAFQKHITRANTSLKTLEAHRATLEHFAEEYLLHQHPPRGLIEVTAEDLSRYLSTTSGKVNLTSFKHFARFLRDTNRVPWEEAEAMMDELKG
jgi:hypothetical protein